MKPVFLILAILIAGLFSQSCRLTRKLLYYPTPVAEERIRHIQETCPHISRLHIQVNNNIHLRGWFITKDLAALPTILYFGGNAEEVSENIEMMDRQLNANVVLMNYRGYGKSSGTPREVDLKADALAICDHIIAGYSVKKDSLIACGRSLGSGIAAYVAWKRHLSGLILISPYDSIAGVATHHFPGWLVRLTLEDKYETIEFSPRIQSKTLIIASAKDTVIPVIHSRRLHESLTGEKQMVLINEAGHNDFPLHRAYWKALRDFIDGK